MNNSPLANSLSISVRIYRALLMALPKTFREHYEIQMVQVFRDSFREAYHRNGMPGMVDLWLHTIVDLVFTALMERITERSQHMFSPKVILWGGVASIFCGLFWMITGLAPNGGALVLALVLSLGGLAGLYSQQAGQGGKLGLAGFAMGIIGTGLALAALWWGFTSGRFSSMGRDPTLLAPPVLILSLGLVILGVGIVMLGVTSLRAKAVHRWRGLPLGLGLLNILSGMMFWLVSYVPLSQGQDLWDVSSTGMYMMYPAVLVLLGLGWMGLGIMLTTEANAHVVEPPPVSA